MKSQPTGATGPRLRDGPVVRDTLTSRSTGANDPHLQHGKAGRDATTNPPTDLPDRQPRNSDTWSRGLKASGARDRSKSRDDLGVEVEKRRFTIAIDGPAAAGKSTVGEIVAHRLSAMLFDTGILYRAVAALALQHDVSPTDGEALSEIASTMLVEVSRSADPCSGAIIVKANGDDITAQLRTPEVDRIVSAVSAHGAVRDALRPLQREIGLSGAVVMVGRDIGTIVMPDADLKVFLLASPEERARRRHEQLSDSGSTMTREDILDAVVKRDAVDSARDIAPLRPAHDALIINSDDLSISHVADQIIEAFKLRLGADAQR